eukprot:TRINITY_DN163_c0_g2_i2.p1 TRINITY_DN163_c0_g2~~TRINITY_DN163_c0_g2_i2.p1  ORF type:complete len:532 (+),score=94.30 TRINITY_DN163_c0_g2_i2:578-2173(+)
MVEAKNNKGETITEKKHPQIWRKANRSLAYRQLRKAVGPISCLQNTWSRDNHHGNVEGGDFAGWDWEVPNIQRDNCVLRIRYNISTNDLPSFQDNLTTPALMYMEEEEMKLDLKGKYYVGQKMGFSKEEIDMNGYYYKTNPQVAPFYNWPTADELNINDGKPLKLQLAINTAQFGRTFEDRTHRFSIKKRGPKTEGLTIHPLGIGESVVTLSKLIQQLSIVSTGKMNVKVGDYMHIEWVGSNTNPNNNAGQGRQGSDRHNILTLKSKRYSEVGQNDNAKMNTYGQFGSSYPAGLDPDKEDFQPFLGFSYKDRAKMASLVGVNTNGGELSELDDSSTHARFDLMKVTLQGIYNFLCTRNNNFSNRSQKGRIVASSSLPRFAEVQFSGAVVTDGAGALNIGAGASERVTVELQDVGHRESGWCNPCGSNYFLVAKDIPVTKTGSTLEITYVEHGAKVPVVYYTSGNSISKSADWNKLENAECDKGKCTIPISSKGIYVVDSQHAWWVYFIPILFGVILCVVGIWLFKVKRGGS